MQMDVTFLSFEIIVAVTTGLVLATLWLINRRREQSQRLSVVPEMVTAAVVAIATAAVLVYRSEAVREQPVLFVSGLVAVIVLICVVANVVATTRLRREFHEVTKSFSQQVAGLGNLQFFPTKDLTIQALTAQTLSAKEKLIATRFSPTDIAIESEYWDAIRKRAFDPSILYIRIHCLAHMDSQAVDGICRLIEELRGAQRFQLAIAMFNNSFEIIIADERECVFCFNDLSMTIRNGFKLDSGQPNTGRVVANFDSTLRRMLDDCHVIIDFEKFVQSVADVRALQQYVRRLHAGYQDGHIPKPVHASEMESYLRRQLAQDAGGA